MIDYGLEAKYQEIFDYLSANSKKAYKDIDMLSNETFSKNPFSSLFIKQKLSNVEAPRVTINLVLKKLFIYYKKSFKGFYFYIKNLFIYFQYSKRFDFDNINKELILIDCFFIIDRILEEKESFSDAYFGLDDILLKREMQYAYMPVFYGLLSPENMEKIFSVLKKKNYPTLFEYDLLSIVDYVMIFLFIIRYPVKVLWLMMQLDKNNYNDKLLRYSLVDNLSTVSFHRYSRYLQGRRLKKLRTKKLKLISWFENQTIHKNLYKGVRDSKTDVYIIGAQLLLFLPLYMSALVDEEEIDIGVVPDKVLVNGQHYIPKSNSVKFEIGPSLRYRKLFKTSIPTFNERNSIVVLLPYFIDDTKNILTLIGCLDIDTDIFIKIHPATNIALFRPLLKPSYKIASLDIYELAKEAKFVIASSTGAMIEMASLGIPIVTLKGKDTFDYNLMIDIGKSILWHEVNSEEMLNKAIKIIYDIGSRDNGNMFSKLGEEYKKLFFCKPDIGSIVKAFEL